MQPISIAIHGAAGRMGRRRMYLNPETYQPLRVELTGPAAEGGKVLVSADLSNYERVEGAGSSTMAGEVLATLDQGVSAEEERAGWPPVLLRKFPTYSAWRAAPNG